jgi:hypothetical protein
MAQKLGEYAKEHISTATTKLITDLPEVLVDMELVDDSFEFTDKITGETKTVNQKVIMIEDEKFRVPTSVIQQLKIHLEDNPTMKKFKVRSSGSGMDTRYTVIPLI